MTVSPLSSPVVAASPARDWQTLRQRVQESGLLKARPLFYVLQILWCLALVTEVYFILSWSDRYWVQILNAAFFAFVSGQIGLLGHDAGHCQIFRKRRWNILVAQFCAFCTGLSATYWIEKHNEHHANPNHEDLDPDIHIPILAFTPEQAQAAWGPARWIIRFQSWFFFPVISLVFISLRTGSIKYLLKSPLRKVWLDALVLIAHFAVYVALPFVLLPWGVALTFIIAHQLLWGVYLGCVFAPNHKGMPIIRADEKLDYLRQQVLTSRNVRGNALLDLWYGGLNYQVEHHLFPNMPRANLARVKVLVKEHCARLNIPYHETGLFRSFYEILSYMRSIGAFASRRNRLALPSLNQ